MRMYWLPLMFLAMLLPYSASSQAYGEEAATIIANGERIGVTGKDGGDFYVLVEYRNKLYHCWVGRISGNQLRVIANCIEVSR